MFKMVCCFYLLNVITMYLSGEPIALPLSLLLIIFSISHNFCCYLLRN